jgi:hypothetical protein
MTYQEARKESLSVEWKTVTCQQGEKCWCRMIEPSTPILYKENEEDEELHEYYVCHSGALDKETAEHIVKVHNESLKK